MKNKKTMSIVVMMSILLSSCLEIVHPPNEVSTKATGSTPATEDIAPFVPATATVELASTDTDSISAIPICTKSGVQIMPPADFGILGTIVYQKDRQGLYTVGSDPLAYSKLPVSEEQKYSTFGFSPDGEWLAFSPIEYSSTNEIVFASPKIVLLSADGEKIEQILSTEDFVDEPPVGFRLMGFSHYSHWINNTTIYAALYSSTMTSTSAGSIEDLPKVLDPFAGVWRKDLLKDLPETAKSYAKGISPDLTRMLYMDGAGLFLKDLEKGTNIWHDKNLFAGFGALMFWSPDSGTVAYANLYFSPEAPTVVLISRDGIAKPIIGSTLPSKLLVEDLHWSPDGHYLAILVWKGQGKGDSVLIYDFEAGKYISQCPIGGSDDMSPNIIWSPDNRYLAYASSGYPLVIMDVQSGETIQLADNGRAVDWSDKFPVTWP